MENKIFHGEWSNKEGIIGDFDISSTALRGCKILFASYNSEDYQGTAFVLFERKGKLYEVNGSHCSCYGLGSSSWGDDGNSQWQPEETTIEALISRPYLSDYVERYGLKERLNELKEEGYK